MPKLKQPILKSYYIIFCMCILVHVFTQWSSGLRVHVGLVSSNYWVHHFYPYSVRAWKAILNGPPSSNYEGGKPCFSLRDEVLIDSVLVTGIFLLCVLFPDNYPRRPPEIRFITPVSVHRDINYYFVGISVNLFQFFAMQISVIATMEWIPVLSLSIVMLYNCIPTVCVSCPTEISETKHPIEIPFYERLERVCASSTNCMISVNCVDSGQCSVVCFLFAAGLLFSLHKASPFMYNCT